MRLAPGCRRSAHNFQHTILADRPAVSLEVPRQTASEGGALVQLSETDGTDRYRLPPEAQISFGDRPVDHGG